MLRRGDQSERLERALEGGPVPHDEETRRLLAAVGALRPGYRRDPARARATREAALREFERALNPQAVREDAGTNDGLDEPEIHQHEVELSDGGRLLLSDIEPITPERAERSREVIERILNNERDRQQR
ncbi:hypothetical protein [Streptomyces sp. NRRL B-24572]|uniref:hypothetical protein n=1 Tax=Streptomyces sp. NRRL B-24572 TaxID=1962156 RepID=UPI000A38D8EA|nr:hypothetical protein [Streptomyces sp. NRRL B-24572]